MDNLIVQIILRFVHIVSAILAVGGLGFLAFCLLPAAKGADDAARSAILPPAVAKFTKIVWLAIAGLIVSGVINWINFAGTYKAMGPAGNALIGTKVLLALILFAMVWAESTGFIKPKNPRGFLVAKLHLGMLVILLAVVLRGLRLAHVAG